MAWSKTDIFNHTNAHADKISSAWQLSVDDRTIRSYYSVIDQHSQSGTDIQLMGLAYNSQCAQIDS